MHVTLADFVAGTAAGQTAASVLQKCVHCGFCNAACPTYRLLGDELDGPRGRIYQVKELLEGAEPAPSVLEHLDRCLTCRACERSCPSGVEYGLLLEAGREIAEERVGRGRLPRAIRAALRQVVPYPRRLGLLFRAGRVLRALLPRALSRNVPPAPAPAGDWPAPRHARRMVVLGGCVQSVATPATNAAAARVLDRAELSLLEVPGAGCCGALSHHLAAREEGLAFARRNVDAWYPVLEQGAEAGVACASGCGAHLRDYGRLLADDPAYAARAAAVSAAVRDLCEVVPLPAVAAPATPVDRPAVAVHTPCTLQHAQGLSGRVEALLAAAGFDPRPVADAAICCGSAGSYALLQPALAEQLGEAKAAALDAAGADVVATANIGCQMHLGARCRTPVRHWVELLDEAQRRAL